MNIKKLVLTAISLIMLTSCAGNNVDLLSFMPSAEITDFGGYEVHYLIKDVSGGGEDPVLCYDPQTLPGEEMIKRINDIKEKYNINVIGESDADEDYYEMAIMADSIKCDIIHLYNLNSAQRFAKNGFLYPLTQFSEYIDLNDTDKYGGANVIESVIVDSVPYTVQPLFWIGYQSVDEGILVYNKDLLAANGITDLHEFYENETWTWDTCENEYLKKFTAANQKEDIGVFGIKYDDLFRCLLYSNNIQFVVKNPAGENVANLNSQEFTHAYEKSVEWQKEYPIDIKLSWTELNDKFMQGKEGLLFTSGSNVTQRNIIYSNFEYGIMPFPSGPDSEYGRWANVAIRTKGAGIAKASDEPEIAAFTLSELFEPFETFGGRNGLYEYYKQYVFLTEMDADIFFDIAQYMRQNYNYMDGMEIGEKFEEVFGDASAKGLSISEALGKNMNVLENMVINYMLPNYDYMYENYYSKFE